MNKHAPRSQATTVQVYASSGVSVSEGANFGDSLSFGAELVLDDVYEIASGHAPGRLTLLRHDESNAFNVSPDTEIGTPGLEIHLDCLLTMMAPDGTTVEALVLVELIAGNVEEVYLLPLAALRYKTGYRLVGVEQKGLNKKFAEVSCLSFGRNTKITMADGRQVAIQDLSVGDSVLTRNAGAQQIRWIGQNTVRAVGDFAPVVVRAGTLNNTSDLVLSPDHRIFIFQRTDRMGAGRKQILIRAKHLINDRTVIRQEGGFVEYFQLLFDDHQIIYAEGIATESLLVDAASKEALPENIEDIRKEVLERHRSSRHREMEISGHVPTTGDVVAKLKEASSG